MILQKYQELLNKSFPEDVYKSTVNNLNELYLEVNPDRILEISILLNDEHVMALVSLFANDERNLNDNFAIYYVFTSKEENVFVILKTLISPEKMSFISISNNVFSADLYEREIKDMFGLIPEGHPNSKRFVFHGNWPNDTYPLRKEFDGKTKPPFVKKEQEFMHVKGTGMFEIPVGPVHAGIIEPGHFRFSVAGEPIINLEAQLYYVHKGTEKLCEGIDIEKCFYVSERISGDETFTNSLAYCQAIEKIAEVKVPVRASYSRVLFAEFERLISHLGDLSGICVDVGYGFATSQFRMLRGWSYIMVETMCGSRFLRSVNKLGGIRKDFISGNENQVLEFLKKTQEELNDTVNIIKSNNLFVDRVENTGIVSKSLAVDLNAVGPAARAAGLRNDVRKDFPYAAYKKLDFKVPEHNMGDVNCRMNVKIEECFESISIIKQVIESMPAGKVISPITKVEPYKCALGYTESPRGENIHWVMTGENNTIFRYKIRTPSFCNWPVVCHAVKGNIVPDFPLINKSFNLSYSGNDL
jgi:Ni,Fe-hydrogenase III large subunit/Ni,Fe-hydrogenase III component G